MIFLFDNDIDFYIIIYACGGCGEVVNTPGCEPGTRGFKPHHSPHIRLLILIQKKYQDFLLSKRSEDKNRVLCT